MLVWTDEGVLAAVNVRTGALNWRLVLPAGNEHRTLLTDVGEGCLTPLSMIDLSLAGDAINDVVHASSSELLLLTK
jgi:hypothetical protein